MQIRQVNGGLMTVECSHSVFNISCVSMVFLLLVKALAFRVPGELLCPCLQVGTDKADLQFFQGTCAGKTVTSSPETASSRQKGVFISSF